MKLKLIKSGLIWLMLCLVGGGAILFIVQQWRSQIEQDYDQAHASLIAVTTQRSDANRSIAHHWVERYREFAKRGIVGEERRIEWVEHVERWGASVTGFRYEIAPQRRLAETGSFDIRASRMTFWMNVVHEGKLLELLERLEQAPAALTQLQGCVIERVENRKQGLKVKCEVDWVTLKEKPR